MLIFVPYFGGARLLAKLAYFIGSCSCCSLYANIHIYTNDFVYSMDVAFVPMLLDGMLLLLLLQMRAEHTLHTAPARDRYITVLQ